MAEKQQEKPISELLNFSIINLDKPAGPTSFSVSDFVRKKLNGVGGNNGGVEINKTSHFGTLDPQVTGVIPIALGRACKLTGFFLGHDKTYVGVIHCHKEQEIKELQKLINENFIGKIKQTPPKKSRVKRQEREREVKRWELIKEDSDGQKSKDFLFISEVQGGTYIRKLCSDLGEKIGGAHMLELRRIKAGVFSESDKGFVNLYDFEKAVEEWKNGKEESLRKILIPAEESIKKVFETVQVKEKGVKALLTGKPLFKIDIKGKLPDSERFAVFCKERFIEIAKKTKEKGIFARAEFVFTQL